MKEKPLKTYAGRAKCGCVKWVCSSEMTPIHLAQEIINAEKQGLSVELMLTQDALSAFRQGCPHEGRTQEVIPL